MKFAIQGAQDNGEFFTPVSLVQMIVNTIEPDHGIVLDPACGSGGMFVQTSHFLNEHGHNANSAVTFYGQEKTATTIRLAKMNLAVHGLEGRIAEANTFYEDQHELVGKCNFVMANPPFNVDKVDAEKIKSDPRLPFGLPGINRSGDVSNGNYLWMSYFYSYLNNNGRAGFVMSSQASSASGAEKEVRRKIVETGHVDIMISIRPNFFYTRTVPCELWFYDKGKTEEMKDKVLMIDARNIYRKVSRKIYDFSSEHINNLTAIIWLYRGHREKYLNLIGCYIDQVVSEYKEIPSKLNKFKIVLNQIIERVESLSKVVLASNDIDVDTKNTFELSLDEIRQACNMYKQTSGTVLESLMDWEKKNVNYDLNKNSGQIKVAKEFESISSSIKSFIKQTDDVYKLTTSIVEIAEKKFDAKSIQSSWKSREVSRQLKEFTEFRNKTTEQLKQVNYYYRQVIWLQSRFPNAELEDIEGLVRLVDKTDIEENDWSLTPGSYVGVAPEKIDEDFDFEETIRDIHLELQGLNEESAELAKVIEQNFRELGL